MKKLYFIVLVLIGVNAAMFCVEDSNAKTSVPQTIEEIEVLAEGEPTCHSGGIGSTACSIEAGVELEGGLSGGCSVTCGGGFFACCDFHCTCIESKEWY